MALTPEQVEAIQFWREHKPELAGSMREGRHAGECPYCLGRFPRNHVRLADGTLRESLWCVCQTPAFEREAYDAIRMLQRPRPSGRAYRLEDLRPVAHADWHKMVELQAAVVQVIARPWDAPWVTVMGRPGCGKSHVLQAAFQRLSHIAAYVYADALADSLRQAIPGNAVADLKDAAVNVPVLILDDLGTEYGGSEYIASTLNAIISQRYMAGRARPTLVATNHTRAELMERYGRMADRLLDAELARTFSLGLQSWRTAAPPAASILDFAVPGTDEALP
jgi:hypothetical protein